MQISTVFKQISQRINSTVQRRLIVGSIGFWLLSIIILALVFLFIGQNQMLTVARQNNIQLASTISRDVNAQLSNITGNTRTFTQHLEALEADLYTQADALLGLRLSSTRYKAIYYFDTNKTLLIHLTDSIQSLLSLKSPEEIIARPSIPVGNEIVDAYEAVNETNVYISDVNYATLDYTPVIYIGMPLSFPNNESRVIVFEVDLTDIWQKIKLATVGQTGFTYIVSSEGTIIAYPEPRYIGSQIPPEIKPVLASYEGSTQLIDPFTGREVVAAYSPVGGLLGWGIIVTQDRAEIYANIVKSSTVIIIILLALGFIGTFGILLLIRNVTRPIKELTRTTQGIAHTGILTKTAMEKRSDEVGQLSYAFDQMIDKVKDIESKLISSEERYRSLFEHANDAIFIHDFNGNFLDINLVACDRLGYTHSELMQMKVTDIDTPEFAALVSERIAELNSKGQFVTETAHLTKDKRIIPTEIGSQVVQYYGVPAILTIARDITERKKAQIDLQLAHDELEDRVKQRTVDLSQAILLLHQEITQRKETEEKLRQSESKYRDLVESANSIILEFDLDGNITFFNRFAQEFFDYKEEEIIGRNILGTIVPEIDSTGISLTAKMADLLSNPERYYSSENENMCRNGDRVWIAWTNRGIYDAQGKLRAILSIGIDRTEQKKASEILDKQERENIAAAERTRLARDLHDAVSQTLFSASIIAEVLPNLWKKDPDAGRKSLEDVRQLTRGALAEMRTLLFELRPSALADADLGDLLRQLADSITGRANISVSSNIEGQCALLPETKIGFYRIAQEALNNIAKHSGASKATISLRCQSDRVELCIIDNGKGFDISTVKPESLGLGIMRERAKAVGASLSIKSKINEGTEIAVIWQDSRKES